MKRFALAAALVLTVACATAAPKEDASKNAADKETTSGVSLKAEKDARPVGNTHCPVMPDEPVNDRSRPVTYKGQLVRVCCKTCQKKFANNPDEYLKKALENAKAAN